MLRRLIGLAAVLLSLAGCGGGDTAATTAAPDTAADTTAATVPDTGATEGSEVVPLGVAPCDLLTAEEVEAATGLAVGEVHDEPPISCIFDLASEGGVYIEVIVEDGQGRFGGAANLLREYLLLVEEGEADVVADVGEQAVCCPFRAIAVDAGDGRFFAVAVGGSYAELAEPLEVLVSLAGSVLGRL